MRTIVYDVLPANNTQAIKLLKEAKDLNFKNCKMLMKETEDNSNRWKGIPCSWIGRITHYCENDYTAQSNLQCNIIQIVNGMFHKIRTKFF